MGFYNKELSYDTPHASASGCIAPSDSRGLKAVHSPVSLWLHVATPYFRSRAQSDMGPNTETDLQMVKGHLEPWLLIS